MSERTRYEFFVCNRAMLSEQLNDVDDRDDDSTETYDVEEVMALATINEASSATERPEYIRWPP